jgi:hypothetical protein
MPDTYCFEMLSLVLALSGSSVGRSYLASQFGLIVDLLTLLHTGKFSQIQYIWGQSILDVEAVVYHRQN